VNQLVSTALAEKLSALATQDFLVQRTDRSRRSTFGAAFGTI